MVRTKTSDAATLDQIAEIVERGQRFLVTSHRSPDGDAVGSMAAMLLVLDGLGKETVAFNPDPVPDVCRFLDGVDRITDELPAGRFDATLLLDCSDHRLLAPGLGDSADLGTIVVLDHHKTQHNVGDLVLRDPEAAAVGLLLYQLFQTMGVAVTRPVAEALFCSVMSDTGSFRYQNTSPDAMRMCAELLELGVNPWRVASALYENHPRCRMELLGHALQTLVVADDGWSASLVVSTEMLAATGCSPDMVDGFINYARGVRGVQVAILFRPGPDGVRVSLRSRGVVDVSRIAERYGGGGHHNAAGFFSTDALDTLRDSVFAEVSRLCSTP